MLADRSERRRRSVRLSAGRAEAIQEIRKAVIQAKMGSLRARRDRDRVDRRRAAAATARITRAEFEALIRPIVDRTLEPCRQALADAGLEPSQIDEVVLVGGSTRIPLVRRLVGELFGRTPHSELNPDEVVALGAAVQADILVTGNREMLLLDVTPLSLGIETMGGVMSKIILRNSTIPATGSEMFTTARRQPDRRRHPRAAGRARAGGRQPIAGALQAARHSADARRPAARRRCSSRSTPTASSASPPASCAPRSSRRSK